MLAEPKCKNKKYFVYNENGGAKTKGKAWCCTSNVEKEVQGQTLKEVTLYKVTCPKTGGKKPKKSSKKDVKALAK